MILWYDRRGIYMWWPCQSRNKTNLRARHGTRANFPCATEPLLIKQRWRVPRNRTYYIYKKTNTMVAVEREGPLSPRPAPLHLAAAYHLSRASPLISSHPISWSVNPSSCVKKNISLISFPLTNENSTACKYVHWSDLICFHNLEADRARKVPSAAWHALPNTTTSV